MEKDNRSDVCVNRKNGLLAHQLICWECAPLPQPQPAQQTPRPAGSVAHCAAHRWANWLHQQHFRLDETSAIPKRHNFFVKHRRRIVSRIYDWSNKTIKKYIIYKTIKKYIIYNTIKKYIIYKTIKKYIIYKTTKKYIIYNTLKKYIIYRRRNKEYTDNSALTSGYSNPPTP